MTTTTTHHSRRREEKSPLTEKGVLNTLTKKKWMITERNNSNFIAKVESLFVSAFDSLPNWSRRAAEEWLRSKLLLDDVGYDDDDDDGGAKLIGS